MNSKPKNRVRQVVTDKDSHVQSNESAGKTLNNLFLQINNFQEQLRNIEEQLTTKSGASTNQVGIQFLLSEYNTLGELWKQTDARVESSTNLYLTTNTLLISATAFFSQQIKNTNLLLAISGCVAFALFIAGLLLSDRILRAFLYKKRYLYGRNLIRGFFAEHSPSIAPYLSLPLADVNDPASSPLTIPSKLRPFSRALAALNLWSSVLLGVALSIMVWPYSSHISRYFIIPIGSLVAILSFVLLTLRDYRTAIKHHYANQPKATK